MFKVIECAHGAYYKLRIRIKAFVLIVPKFVWSRSALRGSADISVNTTDVSVCAAGSAAAVLVHGRLMTADGRMFVVMCEWAEEQRDIIRGTPDGPAHAAAHRGSRGNNFRRNTLKLVWQERPNTAGVSLIALVISPILSVSPLHLSLLNAQSSESQLRVNPDCWHVSILRKHWQELALEILHLCTCVFIYTQDYRYSTGDCGNAAAFVFLFLIILLLKGRSLF